MSDGGYSIMSRDVTKIHKLNDNCVLASSGQQSERTTLWKVLDYKLTMYKHDHGKGNGASYLRVLCQYLAANIALPESPINTQ